MVIENRGGASGSVGAIEAARAAPDGYTWLLAYDNEATNQTVMRLSYRLMQAFAPVTLVATGPLAMVTHQSTPWKTFKDVVTAAKAAPDTISYATSGIGGLAHVSTTTGRPSVSESFGCRMRAMVSVEPPGGKGTIMRIGRSGHMPWARRTEGAKSPAADTPRIWRRRIEASAY